MARVSVRSRGPQYRVQGLMLMQRVHQLMRVVLSSRAALFDPRVGELDSREHSVG